MLNDCFYMSNSSNTDHTEQFDVTVHGAGDVTIANEKSTNTRIKQEKIFSNQ